VPVANQCATCHTGGYAPADGKTVNHIPYQTLTGVVITNCDTCHKGGYVSWRPGQLHVNVSLATQCATCHLTTAYGVTGKPATTIHSTVTGSCETCHKSTASWLTITYTHAPANAVGTGTCDTCHNGTTAKGKTSTHIPIPAGVKCDACHTSQSSFANPLTSHPAVIAATCKSCHSGAYLSEGMRAGGALGKPTNHIPHEANLLGGAAMDCNKCHTTTVYTSAANWTTLATSNVMHNGSQGSGSGWCKACHATGTAYLGAMDRKSLSHDKAGKTDCSTSGCHIPLGTKGTAYTKWK
jgi:Cytochrome c7 and related cytochrome c